MKNLIFFTRQYNDFDHLLPILHYLKNKNFFSIKVFNVGENIFDSKYHMKIFDETVNLKIEKFDIFYKKNYFFIIYKFLFDYIYKLKIKNKYINLLVIFSISIINLFIQYILFYMLKHKLLKIFSNSIVIADVGTEDLFPFNAILKICKKNKIPIVAYAHGVTPFRNLDPIRAPKVRKNSFKNLILKILLLKFDNYHYDRYLCGVEQNLYFKSTLYKNFNQKELSRVLEIGIPRFTNEWIKILDNYYKKRFNDKNKINLCIFLSNAKFNVDTKKLDNLLKRLSNLSNINFIIKGHTRSGLSSIENNLYNNFVTNEETNNIISNIDVAIVYGTSIVFQALQKNVPVIIPSYIDNNEHLFLRYKTCFDAKNEDDIIEFIENFNKSDFISEKNKYIKNFINKIVYNNKNYEEMMEDYFNFFKKI